MNLSEKLTLLAGGAKYDVACTSSGVNRKNRGGIGNTLPAGCCHTFSADGRCVSLLKVLFSNQCIHDCKYCVNRRSNDIARTAFTPEELCELTLEFYRRNYIEGLFLSSGVIQSPDYTMEQMICALALLRNRGFGGYIHAKTIPGASPELTRQIGFLADRLSINIEMPSEVSLKALAPGKSRKAILSPMGQITASLQAGSRELAPFGSRPAFAPAGQSTQMIIGASPESDLQILRLAAGLYSRYQLRRVFYSAYVPVVADSLLPSVETKPPLLREHRLYQADFLLRQYQFDAEELLEEDAPNFNPYLDPKCNWAIRHMEFFPVDVNRADLPTLLRVPGIGPTGARKILITRRNGSLTLPDLKRMGIVLKRAQYFIITRDQPLGFRAGTETTMRALIDPSVFRFGMEQLSMLDMMDSQGRRLPSALGARSVTEATREAVACLVSGL